MKDSFKNRMVNRINKISIECFLRFSEILFGGKGNVAVISVDQFRNRNVHMRGENKSHIAALLCIGMRDISESDLFYLSEKITLNEVIMSEAMERREVLKKEWHQGNDEGVYKGTCASCGQELEINSQGECKECFFPTKSYFVSSEDVKDS